MNAKAILFDLDGVITDTARYHFLAWKRLCDELGLTFTEADNEHLKGIDRLNSLEVILSQNAKSDVWSDAEKEELAARKNGYYQQLGTADSCRHSPRHSGVSVAMQASRVPDCRGLGFAKRPNRPRRNRPIRHV